MELKTLRKSFLGYFEQHKHKVMPSSPLVPHNDPTLMFTNSGMVQFKHCFTGVEKAAADKIATVQKCVRAGGKHNDLENVGYTARHHTFFEMLGNFSFGAYFKDEAIPLAWNFLTKELTLPQEKLYVTVYHKDEEAANIWKKVIGLSEDRIIKIATSDNFWQMGDTGPCGPCSEIFYDHGSSVVGGLPGTPEQDGDRYIEIWNLVFMQFEQAADGNMSPLPRPCIDTGAGLERLAAVMQGKHHNYEIDLFQHIIHASMELSGQKQHIDSHRVIADHLRASAFLIADGVMPSNEGRGYVLRRIMRRAMRHIAQLGVKEAMLYRLFPVLVNEMGEAYPELQRAYATIETTLRFEEEKFNETLGSGLKILGSATEGMSKGSTLPGATAFKLYDTYGFPLDLTKDILRTRGISVDEAGFEQAMSAQKERGRAAWTGSGARADEAIWLELQNQISPTEFWGYATHEANASIIALIQEGNPVQTAKAGEAIVILDGTPFYGEAGGQVGDTGTLSPYTETNYSTLHLVHDTRKYPGGIFGHHTSLTSPIKVGDMVQATVDIPRRRKIMANHSATHLLHKALKLTLGEHVVQKGSLVAPERLRFDFAHPKPLTPQDKLQIENMINDWVTTNDLVNTEIMAPDQAMALFGEKYGDEVRVVHMGASLELCGGTHVERTGDIGIFKIVAEEAIAAGVRRIEAVTGVTALAYINEQLSELNKAAGILRCGLNEVATRADSLLSDKRQLEKEVEAVRVRSAIDAAHTPGEGGVVIHHFAGLDGGVLRSIATELLQKPGVRVVILLAGEADKTTAVLAVAQSAQTQFNASYLIQKLMLKFGGKGGGNAAMAQAGGLTAESIPALMQAVHELLAGQA